MPRKKKPVHVHDPASNLVGFDLCGRPTKAGAACTAPANVQGPDGQMVCISHSGVDPALKAAWGARGAAATNHKLAVRRLKERELTQLPDLTSPESVQRYLAEVAQAVAMGKLPPSAARAIIDAVNAGLKAAELKLGDRLKEIEERLQERD